MSLDEALAIYREARRRAGLPTLPEKRMREIARAKVAFAKAMREPPRKRFGFYRTDQTTEWLAMPTRAPVVDDRAVIDRLEDEAYERDPTLFWLWPDRWNVPLRKESQRPDFFWLYLPGTAA